VLLSATLPHALRQKLIDAFRDGLGASPIKLVKHGYPLATLAGADDAQEVQCEPRDGLSRRVTVTRLPNGAAAIERIADAAAVGAAVVWVRNTVDDAINAAALLRARGIEPLLFHARYAMADRLAIEQEVLRRFGRNGTDRSCVLVATQVVEQSLDIDFDLMVTDLAPADLLIQRAGRLWRHDRGVRCVAGPELLVVSPEPVDTPPANWIMATLPGTGSVYRDHALLWRSARAVFSRGAIVTPDDMRPIIEAVFDRDADGAVPPALSASADNAYSRELSQIGVALQNVLDIRRGYCIDAGSWEPDTRTPTRLEDRPHITLRLAILLNGAIVPYAHDVDLRRAWALSEVAVARYRIASCPLPPDLEAAAGAARSRWGKWEQESEYVVLALLKPDGNGYALHARSEKGESVAARYDARTGLSWPSSGSAQTG
jgi:CRISPR-associated endonuclease/helicase Cas3